MGPAVGATQGLYRYGFSVPTSHSDGVVAGPDGRGHVAGIDSLTSLRLQELLQAVEASDFAVAVAIDVQLVAADHLVKVEVGPAAAAFSHLLTVDSSSEVHCQPI